MPSELAADVIFALLFAPFFKRPLAYLLVVLAFASASPAAIYISPVVYLPIHVFFSFSGRDIL